MPDIRPSLQSAADHMVRGTSAPSPRLRAVGGHSHIQAANDRLVRGTQGLVPCNYGMGDVNRTSMVAFLGVMGALYLMLRK
jgi:hypothetical protein